MHDVEGRCGGKHEVSYDTLIEACAEAGDVTQAEHLKGMMLKAGVETNMKAATAQ